MSFEEFVLRMVMIVALAMYGMNLYLMLVTGGEGGSLYLSQKERETLFILNAIAAVLLFIVVVIERSM